MSTDVYTDANFTGAVLDKPVPAINGEGMVVKVVQATYELTAANTAGDVLRFFRALDPNIIPLHIVVGGDAAVVGATDVHLGLFETDLGAVVDADAFASSVDIDAGAAMAFGTAFNFMESTGAVDPAYLNRTLYEWAGHTRATRKKAYDLGMTLNSEVTTGGTVSIRMWYVG